MTYTFAECTVNNSWWWTEELSETCRVSFQNKFEKLVHLVGFITKKFVMTHGHMNIKNICIHTRKAYVFKNIVCYEIYYDVIPVLCLPVKWCNNVTNEIIMIRDKHTSCTSRYKGWVNMPCVIKCSRVMKYRTRRGKGRQLWLQHILPRKERILHFVVSFDWGCEQKILILKWFIINVYLNGLTSWYGRPSKCPVFNVLPEIPNVFNGL
jgi:hypothetical protein